MVETRRSGRLPAGEGGDAALASRGEDAPRRSRLIAAVVTGTYSWALTVLSPLAVHGATGLPALFAALALLSLFVAPFLPPGRLALVFALDLFLGFSLLSWWAGSHQPISPPFAVFGSFGWLAYTLALGALSTPERSDRTEDPGPTLEPRHPPSRLAALVLIVTLGATLFLVGAAWRIDRPALAVLGHVVALTAILLLLRSGAQMATYVQVLGTKLARPLSFRRALFPLFGLLLLGALAVVWLHQH